MKNAYYRIIARLQRFKVSLAYYLGRWPRLSPFAPLALLDGVFTQPLPLRNCPPLPSRGSPRGRMQSTREGVNLLSKATPPAPCAYRVLPERGEKNWVSQ